MLNEKQKAAIQRRANWANATIGYFAELSDADDDEEMALRDLLANLMHWAHEREIDFMETVRFANDHFHAELSGED